MENRSMFNDTTGGNDLQLTYQSIEFLRETAKWAKFLSILSFISLGFLLIASFFMGSVISTVYEGSGVNVPSVFITGFYLIMALIGFFPTYYMYKFSVDTDRAITSNNTEALTRGLGFIKSCFKFTGILSIIVLVLYALAIIGFIVGAAVGVAAGID